MGAFAMTLTWAVVSNSDFSDVWLGLSIAWLAGGLAAPLIAGPFKRPRATSRFVGEDHIELAMIEMRRAGADRNVGRHG
jgi:hypothetical protein